MGKYLIHECGRIAHGILSNTINLECLPKWLKLHEKLYQWRGSIITQTTVVLYSSEFYEQYSIATSLTLLLMINFVLDTMY